MSTLPGTHTRQQCLAIREQPHVSEIPGDGDPAAYSCVVSGPCESGYMINPEKYYQVPVPNRPAFFDSEAVTIDEPIQYSECADFYPERKVHNGKSFTDFDIDATSTFEACFVQKTYFPKPDKDSYQFILNSVGARRTFRLGTKVFAACREMYELLLGSFEAELEAIGRGSEVLLIPLGPLAMIPFPCLQNKLEKYLIDSFRLRHLSSLLLTWKLNTCGKKDISERPRDVTPISYLNSLPPPTVLPMRSGPSTLSMWRKICLVGKTMFSSHPHLKGADQEVFLIEQLLMNYGVIAHTYGEYGPAPNDIAVALKDCSLLHIASHGSSHFVIFKTSEDDYADYEFCSEDLNRIREDQGNFSPVLVVLNICSGSHGERASIHSNYTNLAHAFHAGGVRCVISSTTRVEDSIAEEIMTSFYNGLLGSNVSGRAMDVVEAMQSALLLQSMRHPTDPSCWAGYIVSGFVRDITDSS